MSLDKYVNLHNLHCSQDMEHFYNPVFFLYPFPGPPQTHRNPLHQFSGFQSLLLPILEHHTHRIYNKYSWDPLMLFFFQ